MTFECRFLRSSSLRTFFLLIGFTLLGFAVTGYHPGAEDDGIYLAAVKARLDPALFPHNSLFITLQLKMTAFDNLMALFVRATGMPVAWAELFWHLASLFLLVAASWSIVRQLFEEAAARWAGIAMLTAMFTLPVAGTALYIADQYLHPRCISTALVLFAVSCILAGRRWQAVPLAALAFVIHPLMGAFGMSFCCVLAFTRVRPALAPFRSPVEYGPVSARANTAAVIPFAWVFGPPQPEWLSALGSRHWFRLYEWTWYEWLGAIAPLFLFWLIARVARRRGELTLARLATAVLWYGVAQQAIAMVLLGPESLIGLSALEPMRYLHLVYIFLALIGGAYVGRHILKGRALRWTLYLLIINGAMFVPQRYLFAGTEHLELPGVASANPWLQAFAWIRTHTPKDAYFALDPNYLAVPGEDYHGFRALAERSSLADNIKDTSVVTKVPELGPAWDRQLDAQEGWQRFGLADFKRLKHDFGVNWVLVSYPAAAGLDCRWHNDTLTVCRIP